MKTSELTGAQLDYWVARAGGLEARIVQISHDAEAWTDCVAAGRLGDYQYKPSTTWRQGGPIIERERIYTEPQNYSKRWSATMPKRDGWAYEYGDTPLIAAMRAYVASKFGDEVDDPVPAQEPGEQNGGA